MGGGGGWRELSSLHHCTPDLLNRSKLECLSKMLTLIVQLEHGVLIYYEIIGLRAWLS